MTWLVTANSNSCRIFNYQLNPMQISLIKEITHEESRQKGSDLISDRPGHYKSGTVNRGSFATNEDPKSIEYDNFAREIAKELDKGRRANQYQNLILAMPPHMNGLLHQHLDSHVEKSVTHNIVKDYTHLKETEILDALKRDRL